MQKKLGRGLEALIPEDASANIKERVESIKVKDILPNQFQPRKKFDQVKLEELINSIREKGIIQPVIVREKETGYELIAGERRWRAYKELNYEEIPAIIKRNVDNNTSLELSLIENIQREDLNPLDEAFAYQDLIDKFEYSLDKIGQTVGKDKTTISNSLRLLQLSPEIRAMIEDGLISAGHAKVLLSVANEYRRMKLAKSVVDNGISVRQLEQIVQSSYNARTKARKNVDPEIRRIEEDLQHKLGTKVSIKHGKKRGRIEIQYFSNEDLQRILDIIIPQRL